MGISKTQITIPSGKQPHNYGTSPFLMGKLTISMAIFNSYVKLPEGKSITFYLYLSPLNLFISVHSNLI